MNTRGLTFMGQYDENLYETRTNLFSSANIVEYLWRRCEKITYPFKPDNSFGIKVTEVEKNYVRGKEIVKDYEISNADIKNADLKGGQEFNFEIDAYETVNVENNVVSSGKVALVYRSDRRYYSLFDIYDNPNGQQELHLIMKVKQKVGLFGSFETEMVYYY